MRQSLQSCNCKQGGIAAAMRCTLVHKHPMRLHAQSHWHEQATTEHCAVRLPSATVIAPHNAPSAACKANVPPASPEVIHDEDCEMIGNQQQQDVEDEYSMHSEEALLNLIKEYLQDPGFQEEVDRMEQLWEKAEEELLAEAGLDEDKPG